MAEVKAAEKGRQSEHLEKEVSSRGNCTSSSKTVDKDSCKDNSDSTAAKNLYALLRWGCYSGQRP